MTALWKNEQWIFNNEFNFFYSGKIKDYTCHKVRNKTSDSIFILGGYACQTTAAYLYFHYPYLDIFENYFATYIILTYYFTDR